MELTAKTFLVLGVTLCIFNPQRVKAECTFDFAADLNIQILNKSTQIPIDSDLNNWNGTVYVRKEELNNVELWGYRVDLRFRNVDEKGFEVTVVLQERTNESYVPKMVGVHNSDPVYEQIHSTALKYRGEFGSPLVIRPDIGEVTLDLTLYPYPKET